MNGQAEATISISNESHVGYEKELILKVEDCTVLLRFPNKSSNGVISDIKRMMIDGHSKASFEN